MSVRLDVETLLRAGYGDRTIARQLGVTTGSVTRARTLLRLPKVRGGLKAAGSLEDFYWRRTRPVDGGHIEWTGARNTKGVPIIHWKRTSHSALRIAYKIRAGHEPIGYAHVTCTHPGCVAPSCVADSAVTPRKGHHRLGPGVKPLTSREEIVRLLTAGHSDRYISLRHSVNSARVARIRAELGLPVTEMPQPVSFETRWATSTEPADGGHTRWVGRVRGGRPVLRVDGRRVSARRAAFERLHGRPAVGPVRPGCGWEPCVRPDHLEDRPMRDRLNTQLTAIFGVAG
ncbi:hypothetical protein [Streptomyces sp. SCL15-4]|uniref:hypothetical protein n=1 Tax=Streptomyces sp. SCL15-4 TaxID=2967221 RepID=UPI002965EF99|nr:hypothetical protein [Streptomyces sp. SCL15-4]